MAGLMFLLAFVCFVVRVFNGHVGDLDLVALGLAFMAAGHLLGGGTIDWVRRRIVETNG